MANHANMRLYTSATSPYGRIVRVVIRELGLLDRIEEIVPVTRQADSPFYDLNPSGRIPFLVLPDGTGFEGSGLICDYLDALDGTPRLSAPPDDTTWTYQRFEQSALAMMDGMAVWRRELRRPEEDRSAEILAHEAARAARCVAHWASQTEHPLMTCDLNRVQIIVAAALEMSRATPTFTWRDAHPALAAWLAPISQRKSMVDTRPDAPIGIA
ncbi:MAG: glutathione S-transferase family protein [Pseudomonadota bacterium]